MTVSLSGPLFVLRPEPGFGATVAAARAKGLQVMGEPLSAIEATDWDVPDEPFDGLLVGSANVFRHGGAGLEKLRAIPVHCVGEVTAQCARTAGHPVSTVRGGGLGAVVEALKGQKIKLLRLAGEARVALDPPRGMTIVERTVYRNRALPIGAELAGKLADGGVVALHSGEAARHFRAECERLKLDKSKLLLALIGPRLAAPAGPGWQCVASAETPDDTALLALAARLCKVSQNYRGSGLR